MTSSLYGNIFFLLGGIATLMFGMNVMGNNLEIAAGAGIKKMMKKVTNNRFLGVAIGTGVTAVVQSSTAVTLMIVGFVNAGIMTLAQSASVIMGANIGTTMTAQILALSGGGGIEINAIAALFAVIGIVFTMVFKKDKMIRIGNILLGLGLIFISLEVMSSSVNGIVYDQDGNLVPLFQTIFSYDFPLLLILIGIVLTALLHSSSTVTGILVVLASVFPFENSVFVILGSNIGTCMTAMVSSIGTNVSARRTAVIHLLFNVIGCVIFIAPVWIWRNEIASLLASISDGPERVVANFHTIFNVISTAIMLPFTKLLVKAAEKIVPDKHKGEKNEFIVHYDERLLSTPAVAIDQVKNEILEMAKLAKTNLNLSRDMLVTGKFDEEGTFNQNEEYINTYNSRITGILTQILSVDLEEKDEKIVSTYYHVIMDIERIGDYAENIKEYASKLRNSDAKFSENAINELNDVFGTLNQLFDASVEVYEKVDAQGLAKVDELEESIDVVSKELENKHVERLQQNRCSPDAGSIFLQAISNLERIGDHISNIASSVTKYQVETAK